MIESEDKATSENPPSASNAPRSANASVIAMLFIAAAFVVSNWFFYHQGQRDAAVGNTEAVTAAMHDALTPPSNTGAQPAGADDRTTMPSASDDTAQPAILGDVPKTTATKADAATTGTAAQNDGTTAPATSDGSAAPAAPGDMPKLSATDAVNIDTMVVHPPSAAASAETGREEEQPRQCGQAIASCRRPGKPRRGLARRSEARVPQPGVARTPGRHRARARAGRCGGPCQRCTRDRAQRIVCARPRGGE